jgi:hypothetical protein
VEPSDPFAELADESAADDAASRRARARWLQRQAAEEATLAGTLVDLAESGADVSLRSRSGRMHRGTITSVGGDFLVMGDAWIALAAVVAVRTAAARSTPGDRGPARDVRLAEALGELAADRPSVVVVPVAGEPLRGELVAVGADVLTLTLAGDVASRCDIALGAVAEVVLLG